MMNPSTVHRVFDQVLHAPVICLCSQGVEFTLEIKNLALSDSKGHDLEKKIVVRVTAAEHKQVGASAVLCTFLLC